MNLVLMTVLALVAFGSPAAAAPDSPPAGPPGTEGQHGYPPGHPIPGHHAEEHHDEHETPGTFDPHGGTWFNWLARMVFGESAPVMYGPPGDKHVVNISSVRNDYIVISYVTMICIGLMFVVAARKAEIRPTGRPLSLSHLCETLVEAYREYLVGVMGRDLAHKYAPLIASFFFTIIVFNWLGLLPGMLPPTANPNVPIALALVAFLCTHAIALKEVGFKSWFMHFVGEPKWLAPINFPIHIIGELIKPVSLAMRLFCNMFGKEMVLIKLIGLGIATMGALPFFIPIPFQLPMLFLGAFLGFLQALVFSTLLAIYISVLSTHHDEHDEHNAHGSVEHTRLHGRHQVIGHPTESTVGS